MKCPSCGYKDGFIKEERFTYEGTHGEFYKTKEPVVYRGIYLREQSQPLYACPKCGITFIKVKQG